ncbi:phox (PX) domain-containing protein isoform X2 [Wolffia australiana]
MEEGSEGDLSPHPLDGFCRWSENRLDNDDDASSGSSRFSSCEGSELERYCSANSLLGTASVCSSSFNHAEFLESFRTVGFGDDFASEGPDRLISSQIADQSGDNRLISAANGSRTDLELSEELNFCSDGLGSAQDERSSSGDEFSGGEREEDGVSSDWASNLDRIGMSRRENVNPLLMNSSVAFGNDDWNEFERETEVLELESLQQMEDNVNGVLKAENSVGRAEGLVPESDYQTHRSFNSEEECSNNSAENCNSVGETAYDESSNHVFSNPTRELDTTVPVRGTGSHDFRDAAVINEAADKIPKAESSELFDDMVLEMEEILLDSGEGAGHRASHTDQKSYNLRDGSSTASTSGTDGIYTANQLPISIDGVEVIGARQKKGDVSFGERLVGVKEYTVYILRIRSGKDQWEAERRYRDFLALYYQLKTLFRDHGLTLPSPWNNVVRESRNLFGNSSSSVISQRSILIEDCLNSVLHFKFPSGHPSPLIWFLYQPSLISVKVPVDDISELGKTISLVLEVKARKSMGQLLESQRYLCAACHQRLDSGKTLAQGLVSKLGWEKNRFCEYTGQLFCSVCHTNDYAILPARVLHHWDFSRYPVSQLAKAFLDSIYDQPMLCVSAVNPFLLSKVPALQQVMGVRKRIASMLPCILCPFRRSIYRGLGNRRYLLDFNDFFAMRDLVDLSKGAFSGLPTLVETVEKKILTHIAQQCLICYDAGAPCAARGS